MSGNRVSKAGVAVILTAAGAVAGASQAEAALYYWNDFDPGYYRPTQPLQPRRPKVRRNAIDKKTQAAEKETGVKPQGPLVISISIDQQKIRVYDSNGLFAEDRVSTGMKGHPTPMGVFSVIQKHRMHHSNIYSGAPMPYMQRITWSGVAMHQGVLPGYPASHGCIRMPATFAIKMWNWTKMGARVLVTPGEMTPAAFSHPFLVTQKVVPQPVAQEAPQVDAPLGVKSDKGTDAAHEIDKPTETADAKLELRSTVGHARTADASGVAPANSAVTMSDASPASASGTAETTKSEAAKAAAPADDKAKPAETATGEVKSSPASGSANAEEQKADVKADAKPADEPKTTEKQAEPANSATDAPAKKDASRLPGQEKPKPELKRDSQVAVFISRKDGKLYVRQNFKPVFEVPVTIAPSEKLLGTHVFTAEVDKKEPNLLRWSVVSLPVTARNAQKNDDGERATRRRKGAAAIPAETKPASAPNTAAEALDRITVPQDVMATIAEALNSGSSIMVSDQGINQGETGEGTDFIVRLR
ncbi:MAG: L,D-transpeptidase family protein [Bradyrhizobium sp.]|nr:L,D-transpeptidase family protein [Bradyrhizobium sp.]